MIREINSEEFKDMLEHSEKPMLVSFIAEKYSTCRMMAPILSQVANEYKDRFDISQIDVEKNPDIALEYRVLSVPTMLIFRDGRLLGKIEGVATKAAVDSKLSKYFDIQK